MRRHNLSALLGHVHRYGPTSRAELTRLLGLNRSTIAALVDDLAARRWVREQTGVERSSPGRPSNVVSVRTDTVAVIAVVIGVDAITAASVMLGGKIHEQRYQALPDEKARSVAEVLRVICRMTKSLLKGMPAGAMVVGVGVAVPGVVRRHDGLVHFAPNLGWREVPLGTRLRSRLQSGLGLDVPVTVRNDAGLGAIAEHIRGVGHGVAHLVYLHAEVGVGGGIIAAGQLLEGAAGYGGEVGHMRVNPQGTPCRCGSRGCWETEVGEDVLVLRAGRKPGGRAAVEAVLHAATEGDPGARSAVETTAKWLGIGLANIVNCFNPDMVVLGGVFEDLLGMAGATVVEQMRSGLVTAALNDVELVGPTLRRDSVLFGAAEVALETVLADPTRLRIVPAEI